MTQLIAKIDTFTKAGRYVPRGAPLDSDEIDYSEDSTNVIEAPAGLEDAGAIEMSAIAPSGPNPQNPQQIAPGTVQTEAGYVDRGQRVVGEVTKPAEQRLVEIVDSEDTTQGDVQEALDNASLNNSDDALVAGTVADITAGLADADEAELQRLRAAEVDREKPRKGVLSAIDAELDSRQA